MKSLQELTIMDNWMFGAVMLEPENCQHLLELALDMKIDHVEVMREKSLVYNPQYKGVRLDVYAKDDQNTCFNVEMQVQTTPIPQRSRYYHSQIDMEMLQSGKSYDQLPDSYVIFITNYDPFTMGKYRYSFRQECKEIPGYELGDGSYTIILNNRGHNPDEVPSELAAFLNYTKAALEGSDVESEDAFVCEIQRTIQKIKASREMGGLYMTFQEMMTQEREEGRKEGREEGRKEGREEGREEGRKEGRDTLLKSLVEQGLLSEEKALQLAEELSKRDNKR